MLDARASGIAVLVADLDQFVPDHLQQAFRSRQDVRQIADYVEQFAILFEDLVLLEAREPVQAQVKDRLRLRLGEQVGATVQAERLLEAVGAHVDRARSLEHFRDDAATPRASDQRRPWLRPATAKP